MTPPTGRALHKRSLNTCRKISWLRLPAELNLPLQGIKREPKMNPSAILRREVSGWFTKLRPLLSIAPLADAARTARLSSQGRHSGDNRPSVQREGFSLGAVA